MESETRLFFVVDSIEDNAEIFETLSEAEKHWASLSPVRQEDEVGEPNKPRIYIAMVKNSFREIDGVSWNYDDYSDTFEEIKTIQQL